MTKKILITGAAGQLGLALYRLLENDLRYKIYRTDSTPFLNRQIDALDIADEAAVTEAISKVCPDIIINCAAMTAVDLCESEADKAYRINALGAKYVAMAARETGAVLFHISSDYVYDGTAARPYSEDDIPNPISVYGKTKLQGDNFVLQHCSRFFILRSSGVYGEGKNFIKTMLKLAGEGRDIKVVTDQIVTPTSALELARAIVFLMDTDSYGIYNATCEGSTSWHGFAEEIFKIAGMDVTVGKITSSEYKTPAKRPAYSVLDNRNLRERHGYYMKEWKEAIKEYMDEILNKE
jgi:dTDP-4-dehydrorhamnose reductase